MADWQAIEGGVTAPQGFQAAGIAAGFKASGQPDLALILSETEAIAAGVLTASQVRAACVDDCHQRLQDRGLARAILCNAGQANAATGEGGRQDARESVRLAAEALGISPEAVLPASTGLIGERIPMAPMRRGMPQLVAAISPQGSEAAARAIATTDLATKSVALETEMDGRPVRIGGIAKGSGMIAPNMATMLAFISCDAAVSRSLWQQMVARAAERSFNQVSIDGDTSTNDALLALANGQSRTGAIVEPGPKAERLEAMLVAACQTLARAIARDGEGATCLIEVRVSGAPNDRAARQIAKTVVSSPLVKAATFGRDPNWGRIAAAAGRAGVPFDASALQIALGDRLLLDGGQPVPFDRQAASAYLQQAAAAPYLDGDTVTITLSLDEGSGQGVAWGCDLSYDYVRINAEYTT